MKRKNQQYENYLVKSEKKSVMRTLSLKLMYEEKMTTDSTEVVLDFEKNIVEIEEKIKHLGVAWGCRRESSCLPKRINQLQSSKSKKDYGFGN